MKTGVLVSVVLMLSSISCSVIDLVDEAYDVYDSVRDKFRNFLETMESDLTVNVDCTIFAVEQLILNDDNSYRERCLQQMATNEDERIPTDYPSPVAIDGTQDISSIRSDLHNNNIVDTTVQKEFDATLSQLNKTYLNAIKPDDVQTKLTYIRNSLKGESKHLQEVDDYLRRKLDNLSVKKNNINKTTIVGNASAVLEDIWSNLQIIQKANKVNNTKDDKVKEINNVVNNILTMVKKTGIDKLEEAKVDTMIDTLASDINAGQNANDLPVHSENTFKPARADISIENILIVPTKAPPLEVEINNKDLTKPNQKENIKNTPLTTAEDLISPETIEGNNEFFSDYYDDFDSDPGTDTTTPIPLARSKEARNIIKQNKYSQSVIDKYFDNPKYEVDDLSLDNLEDIDYEDIFANI